jgi:hypothetical protein
MAWLGSTAAVAMICDTPVNPEIHCAKPLLSTDAWLEFGTPLNAGLSAVQITVRGVTVIGVVLKVPVTVN